MSSAFVLEDGKDLTTGIQVQKVSTGTRYRYLHVAVILLKLTFDLG